MIINTLIFIIFSFVILFSTIGYGLFFSKIIVGRSIYLNLASQSLFGILLLYFISSFTHLFFPHNYVHNLILLLVGLFFFIKFINKNASDKDQLKYIFFVFCLLYLGFLISKTNEDFGYYHLPNSLHYSNYKLQFGLGNLNHGFKHYSSLFLINSLFYLPKLEFYLFNITNFMFQTFFFSSLLLIFKIKKINNFTKLFIFLSFIIYLTKFHRLSEYGADYAGQFLVLLAFVYATILFGRKNLKILEKKKIFLITSYLIIFSTTTKFLYIIYIIAPLSIFIISFKLKEIINYTLDLKFLLITFSSIVTILFFNFSSTGCLIYPVNFTCFYNTYDWALNENVINYLNLHYESWSKGGKGTGYELENLEEYISGLNWVNFWFKNYFFTKISDFIFVVMFILLIFFIFVKKNLKKTQYKIKNKKIAFNYISILIILILWFLNFPSLRYAGYSIFFIFLIYPFCYYFYTYIDFNNSKIVNKTKILALIALIFFNLKNVQRINSELNLSITDHHNFKNFPFFWVDETEYDKIEINGTYISNITNNKKCWNTPPTCVRGISNLLINKKNGYIFYSIK